MKRYYLVYILLGAMLFLSACMAPSERTDKPAPDWSRALYLGRASIKQPVALQIDSRGHVHMAWIEEHLRYAHMDEQAHVIYNGSLAVDLPNLRAPQLAIDGQDNVHLAWMSRRDNRQQIHHALVSPDGSLQDRVAVSPQEADASGFGMYVSAAGAIRFLWTGTLADGEQGLIDMGLQENEPKVLVSGAIDPFVVIDPGGTTHITWLQPRGPYARTIYYATLEPNPSGSRLVPEGGQALTGFEIGEGAIYYSPVIGLAGEDVYVLWSEQGVGGGLAPTSAFTYYVRFPRGQPERTTARMVNLPGESRPEYETYDSPFGLAQLDLLAAAAAGSGTDFVNAPAVTAAQHAELPVAVSVKVESPAETGIQMATMLLRDGEVVGYQLASDTPGAALIPSLAADAESNLHLAWIDTAGFRQYDVYYATLAPAARAWLNRTTADDVMRRGAAILFGVLSGVGLLPIAGIWTFPAILWVVIFFIASRQEEMSRRPAQIGFVIALAIYVGAKALLLPGLFAGTPFLNVVPQHLVMALSIAVPVLILLVSLVVVYAYARRSDRPTIFKTFLVFCLVDVVLTLVLYAPGFFNQA